MKEINFFNEDVSMPDFDKLVIADWIGKVIRGKSFFTWNINVIFCSDDYLLKVNREYLNHDYYTDVITFDYSEYKKISGDIFISTEMITFNAKKFGREEQNELMRVIIHGVLHLCGYKDKSEAEKCEMTKAEDEALELLN